MDEIRYFDNPFSEDEELLWKAGSLIDKVSVQRQLSSTVKIVFSKNHSFSGLYTGSAGITYTYLHLRHVIGDPDSEFLSQAINLYEDQSDYYNACLSKNSLKEKDLVGFLSGKAGYDAVGAVLGKVTGNEKLQRHSIKNFAHAAKFAKPLEFLSRGSDELFVGRAGYLMGVLWLQKEGYECPVPKEDVRDIWNSIIQSGRKYSKEMNGPCPLLYAYHDKVYLGAAHGLSSILQVLLSFPDLLKEDLTAKSDIKDTIDFILTLQDKEGNFPSSLGKTGPNHLVHWCHGAGGIVYMLAKAYLTFGDAKYLQSCIACGEVVWQRGLLKKGPGICHGVAGSGYVFLLLHKLLKEPEGQGKYLYRAAKFAEFLQTDQFKKFANTPDRPYSLYEGLAGTACFLGDLLQPESGFPFLNIFHNYQM